MLSVGGGSSVTGDAKIKQYIEGVALAAENAPALPVVTSTTGGGNNTETQTLVPTINAFEEALAENKNLLKTLKSRVISLEDSISGDDTGELYERVQSMGGALVELFSSFKNLEVVFEQSQSVASRSGRLIESLCRLRRRSVDAKELFLIFSDLASGKGTGRLDAIIDSASTETRSHGAKLMRRLKMLQEAKIEEAAEATRIIEQISTKYEEGLLEEFHSSFEENNMNGMRIAASLLMKYNGGESCVKTFVSEHAFFVDPVKTDQIISKFHRTKMVMSLALGKVSEPDPVLLGLYEQIAQTAEADWQYLEAVFEEPLSVMNYLMRRIFQEPVKQHINEILNQALAVSELAYLRTLFACYQATSALIKRLGASYARHIKEASARSNEISEVGIDETIKSINNQLEFFMEDLFSDQIQLEKYKELEYRVAEELYSMANSPLQSFVQLRKSSSRGMISSLMSSARSSTIIPPGGSSSGGSPRQSRGGDAPLLVLFADGEPLITKGLGEDGIPSEKVIRHCLTLHAELAARLFTLLPTDHKGEALEESLCILLTNLLDKYVDTSLDHAFETSESGGGGFSTKSFTIVQASCRILSIILLYCQQNFLPLIVTASSAHYRSMVNYKTEAAGRVTEKIDRLLRKELEGSLKYITDQLLSKQRKSDFKPRPDDLESLMGPSQACDATCQFVSQLVKVVIEKLDKANATSFLAELGSGLYQLLLDHLKNFTISDTGAMILQNDLKRYRALVDEMTPATSLLRDRFDMLWELGHLFVVRPENLRSVLQEGHLGRIDVKLVYPYISQRADYTSAKIDLLFPDMEKSFSRLFS